MIARQKLARAAWCSTLAAWPPGSNSGAPGHTDGMPSRSWTVPAFAGNVAQVRQWVMDFAYANGVAEPLLSDVLIAVSEAVANAVVHAFRGVGESGTVSVAVAVREGEWIDVRVTDDGSGMAARDDSPGAGLGLPLIRHLAHQFDYRSPPDGVGTELWMRFRLTVPSGQERDTADDSPST